METSSDKITFRYSPAKKNLPRGILKPTKAHRDTWASNVFNQINWWLPFIMLTNQIQFLLHQIILKKVDNNSDEWSFENFKKLKTIHQLQFQK